MQSGIIRSVRNEVRGLIGFQAELTDILDLVEERFGKAPTVDKLQKELYLLGQERRERKKSSSSPVIWNRSIGICKLSSLVIMTGNN